MAKGLNKTLVPPSKKTTNFLYNGLALFYPESVFGIKEGKKRAILDYWSKAGYKRTEFAELLWNITKTEDTDQAAKIVLGWKKLWDENKYPDATVPENLDELLSSLDENVTGEKELSSYKTQTLAKRTLLESQKLIEKTTSAPEPEITISSAGTISKAAAPLSIFAGKILTAPFRAVTYISGPTSYSSSAKGEGSGVATARYMLTHGISSASIRSLENRAQQLGITPSQLQNLAALIKTEQETHPFSYKWVSIIYSGQKASLSQAQIASLLIPSTNGSTAVLPRKSFIGNVFGRIGQQLFGKLASKALKTVGGKVATKVATTAATQAAATAVAPGVANIIVLVGQAIIGKIKDLISSLKSKEGKEGVLALVFGSMVVGGIVLGGTLGAVLVVGGLVPGLGFLVTKAGGFGPLGSSVGGYGQAFLAGITGVLIPAIGIPVIVALISIPILIAIILFIINSGAYIVPPKGSSLLEENPYISVEKTVAPDGSFENEELPLKITYTITITPKKGSLTNVTFEHKCEVIKDGPTLDCPSSLPIEIPKIISPADPYIYTYSETLEGSKYIDSLVLNTFTVTADTSDVKGTTSSGAASIIIGDPPTGCYNVAGEWPSKEKVIILSAISSLVSNHSSYVAKVCASYSTVNLYYDPPRVCGAWGCAPGGNTLYFNSKGLGNLRTAIYILAHESGHVLAYGTPSLYQAYLSFPGTLSELPVCTYGGSDPAEGFAESIANYAAGSSCLENEPNNRKFAETKIFK